MKKLLYVTLLATGFGLSIAAPGLAQNLEAIAPKANTFSLSTKQNYPLTSLTTLENAFQNRISNLQVLVSGQVTSVLSDDNNGSRHQRFIIRLANGQTLLVAHNIDLAPRVSGLQIGDTVYIHGEYEWNDRGGVIHWTHHDPNGQHPGGWIDHNGQRFQ